MKIIVQKFGGSSVADIDKMCNVASKVVEELKRSDKVLVVVSAMLGVTNELVQMARKVSALLTADASMEYDNLLSSGEQVSASLLAMILQSRGLKARSWLGWQLGLNTDDLHTKARILDINTDELKKSLENYDVAVVAGFQGINNKNNRITTLGRGGSDTSAVAIATVLNAKRCDIYTDVDGIYSSDPRKVPKVSKIDYIAYEEMLEMASLGAKVLQMRSVEMAMKYNVKVQVLSSFDNSSGTFLVNEDQIMERKIITAITHDYVSNITLNRLPNRPGVAAQVFKLLSESEINVDMIAQSIGNIHENHTNISFTVSNEDAKLASNILSKHQPDIGFKDLLINKEVVKVSAVGLGMKSHAGIAYEMFQTCAKHNINIKIITTSEIRISILIHSKHCDIAMQALHQVYGLDSK